jgi:tetratricopeptide (TPR) repeat protein
MLRLKPAPKSPKGDLKDKNLLCLAPFRGLGAQLKVTLILSSPLGGWGRSALEYYGDNKQMNINKRLRIAEEKFQIGLDALEAGNCQLAVDELLEAAELFRVIKEREQAYAGCLINAANALQVLGNDAKAIVLLEKSITILKKAFGHDYVDIAISFNNLANIYDEKGDYAKSWQLNEKALAIQEKHLGVDHPEVAYSLSALADTAKAQEKYEVAIPLYERALVIWESTLGSEHPDLAELLDMLAECYETQHLTEKAIPLRKRANALRENVETEQSA